MNDADKKLKDRNDQLEKVLQEIYRLVTMYRPDQYHSRIHLLQRMSKIRDLISRTNPPFILTVKTESRKTKLPVNYIGIRD